MALQFVFLADHPELVPQVIRWWYTAWADRMAADPAESENRLRDSLSKKSLPIHIIAMLEDTPVGTAALKLQELGDLYGTRQNWLGNVFVDDRHRGQRFASQLAQHVIELARQHEMPHLHLQTADLSGGLYARLGWQPVEQFEYRGQPTLLMLRQL